jgi:hypothetical protein
MLAPDDPWVPGHANFLMAAGQKFGTYILKSGPKVMTFVVIKPYQLPPEPWISSIWVWQVMLESGAVS